MYAKGHEDTQDIQIIMHKDKWKCYFPRITLEWGIYIVAHIILINEIGMMDKKEKRRKQVYACTYYCFISSAVAATLLAVISLPAASKYGKCDYILFKI